jgi:rubredoxin
MSTEKKICCPKCNSDQLTATKKGFSGTKAVGGALLTGGIGLLAGTIGSNKIKITCLACGHSFKPGEGNTTGNALPKKEEVKASPAVVNFLIVVLIVVVGYWLYSC